MARAKKETALTPEERLQAALVPDWEWPYKLPENWCWTRIGNYVDYVTDYVANGSFASLKANVSIFKDENYALMVKTQDFANGFTKSLTYTDKHGYDFLSKSTLHGGELILSNIGSVGKVFRVPYFDRPMTLASNSVMVKCYNSRDYDWMYYFLLSPIGFEELKSITTGTAVPKFNKTDLKTIPLPVSHLAEQQRIVDRIESLFAKLDEAKEKAQAVVDSFETRKAAILHKAFTGELTAKWREEHYATDNTVLMDIKNYSSSWSAKEKDLLSREQAKSEVVVLDNGHEWIRCTIGAVGRVTNGSTPLRKEPKYWSGKIPWISSGEVRNNIIESSNECISEEGYANSSVKLLPIGTVLIAMIGEGKTRGQSAILDIEATINQNVAAIVVEHNCVLPYYIWYWLQMNYAKNREKGSGSGPQALNCQRVRELDFFVPNLKEQKEVVNILRKALAKEQQSKEAAEAVLDQINLMKKSILARAFRGEMGTNDPSEESAVELLKQII